jgi:CDP-diacylglycerol--serine O-phosphatidyltransferase
MTRSKRTATRIRRVDLRKTLFVLPNLITLGSVFCGLSAILIASTSDASETDFYRAALLLCVAMLCDLLDGRVARMTRTQSAFGLQLDSLADVLSFGLAPAVLVYRWVLHRNPILGLLTAFLFVACAAVRLARFNVLSSGASGAPVKPGRYIIGLPTPPASGVLISLVLANHALGGALGDERYTGLMFAVTACLSFLMVSTVRFRSFKDVKLDATTVTVLAFVLGSSAVVWDKLKPQMVLVWLLSCYVAIGVFESLRALAFRMRHLPPRDSVPPAPDPS